MKKQRYIVEIEMPDGDFISAGLIKDIIQTDCDVEDEGRMKVIVQETSLPSNMDEAALEVYPKMSRLSEPHGVIPADNKTHYLGDANEENRAAFKSGAKWMADQGSSYEGVIYGDHEVLVGGYPIEFRDFFLPFKNCDKVIVQIRRINEKEE